MMNQNETLIYLSELAKDIDRRLKIIEDDWEMIPILLRIREESKLDTVYEFLDKLLGDNPRWIEHNKDKLEIQVGINIFVRLNEVTFRDIPIIYYSNIKPFEARLINIIDKIKFEVEK